MPYSTGFTNPMFAEVIVDIAAAEVDKIFDYDCGELAVKKGIRVTVPFGRMSVEGFVIGIKQASTVSPDKIKSITAAVDEEPLIGDEMFALMDYMVATRHYKKVDVLRLFIPAQMRGGKVRELYRRYAFISDTCRDKSADELIKPHAKAQRDLFYYLSEEKPDGDFVSVLTENFSAAALRCLAERGVITIGDKRRLRNPQPFVIGDGEKRPQLTSAQSAAVTAITIAENKSFLLFGVTGSGKTEVYMRCIEDALIRGKSAIMLVPEISLTAQVLRSFRNRFGDKVALMHSGLGDGEKFDEWMKAKTGEARVVLGARSAIFAPLTDVGVIIIDEEHDTSYISEHSPRYSTVDVADFRQKYNGCNLVLGSATPSIETYYAAQNGKYELLTMPDRINKKPMPEIIIVNMCDELASGNNSSFSERLLGELDDCLKRGNQAMLFINRRGYASYLMCRRCGYVAKCERCDVSLVYHRDEELLKCHYCGNRYSVLSVCPQCGNAFFKQGNVGTQKVVEQLSEIFGNAKILRMDNDTTRTKDAHARILDKFRAREADILVGTQMIAKGHDFPDVTLVGILDSDLSLHFADYRSVERTFQLTTQVAGRAGRDNKPGKVVLQTYSPNHYVYKYVKDNDYCGFYEKESNLREVTKYPPYSTIIRVLVSGTDENRVSLVLKSVYEGITKVKDECPDKFIYLGYMRAPLKRIMNEYRMQIIIRLSRGNDNILNKIFEVVESNKDTKITSYAEINPIRLS